MTVTAHFLTLVPKFAAWAESKPQVSRAWLYGSRLRGTQRDDSDLDVAVEIAPMDPSQEIQLAWMEVSARWHNELSELAGLEVELNWYGGDATPKITQYISCCSMLAFERPNKSLERTRER